VWKDMRLCKSQGEAIPILLAIGFFLSLAAYAISAVFPHLSYQRYFWLLVAVSSVAVRIIHQASQEKPWRHLAGRPNETD